MNTLPSVNTFIHRVPPTDTPLRRLPTDDPAIRADKGDYAFISAAKDAGALRELMALDNGAAEKIRRLTNADLLHIYQYFRTIFQQQPRQIARKGQVRLVEAIIIQMFQRGFKQIADLRRDFTLPHAHGPWYLYLGIMGDFEGNLEYYSEKKNSEIMIEAIRYNVSLLAKQSPTVILDDYTALRHSKPHFPAMKPLELGRVAGLLLALAQYQLKTLAEIKADLQIPDDRVWWQEMCLPRLMGGQWPEVWRTGVTFS